MNKRFLVVGGYVTSRHDGQTHYIDARRVAQLYGVDVRECILVDEHNRDKLPALDTGNLIVLKAREDGRYDLTRLNVPR